MIREIVLIDEEKCDGCGLCVPACHEGAIRIVEGKARLVAERLCDGLGACLGHCPQGAIRIEKREAADFDQAAVDAHLGAASHSPAPPIVTRQPSLAAPAQSGHGGGCPSQRFARLGEQAPRGSWAPPPGGPTGAGLSEPAPSELAQWPVQLKLLPVSAPIFEAADLLLTADCVPFAMGDFHSQLLRGRAVAIACPKLDDTSTYVPKLTQIFAANRLRSITVAHMEVPCCTGLLMMAMEARAASGADVPLDDLVISVRGEVLRRRRIPLEAATPWSPA